MTSRTISDVLALWWARLLLGFAAIAVAIACASVVALLTSNSLLSSATLYAVVLAFGLLIEANRHGGSGIAFGFAFGPDMLRGIAHGSLMALFMLGVVAAVAVSIGGSFHAFEAIESSIGVARPSFSFSPSHIAIASIVLLAAGEEIVFRGTIMLALASRIGDVWTIVLTSILFSCAHLANPGGFEIMTLVNVGLAGGLLAAMALRTSSLWYATFFHIVWNIGVSAFFGTVSGQRLGFGIATLHSSGIPESFRWIVDGTFGIEQGLVTTILMIGGIIVVVRSKRYDAMVAAARMRIQLAERSRLHSIQ